MARLGPPPTTITPADPRSVLSAIYASRGVDPDNPGGALGSLGNVDYYINRLQDTGGWQGGNIPYWKQRLASDIDLSQTGLGAPAEQNRALILAGLGNQPGAYAPQGQTPLDEQANRQRGRLLDLLRGPGQAAPVDQARQILEPQEQRYAESTQMAPVPMSPGYGAAMARGSFPVSQQQLEEQIRTALARGDVTTAARARRALASLPGGMQTPGRSALFSAWGA